MRDRLIDLLDKYGDDISLCDVCKRPSEDCEGCNNEQLAEFLLANGVIVPPCKVGDTVYYLGGLYNRLIKSATVEEIILNSSGASDLLVTNENDVTFEHSIDIFFLTREEAEQALKGGVTK